jgi:orotate phosphoribosyltransferase-like protein
MKCECPLAGFCDRHNVHKTKREHQICQGENIDPQMRQTYIDAWEAGNTWSQMNGRVKAVNANIKTEVHSGPPQSVRLQGSKSLLDSITPEDAPCQYRGELLREQGCTTCGQRSKTTSVFRCNLPSNRNHECTLTHRIHSIKSCQRCEHGIDAFDSILQKASKNKPESHVTVTTKTNRHNWATAFKFGTKEKSSVRFISKEQFTKDVISLIAKLPPDITAVAGVARSGVFPASLVSMMIHRPLYLVRQYQGDIISQDVGVISGGNGWRLSQGVPSITDGKVLVLDDTVMTGNSFKAIEPMIAKAFPQRMTGAIYVNPRSLIKPDVWAVDLPWPHLLEWNIFNSVLLGSMAIDFDGILCHDCPRGSDDDGPKYLEFLENAAPKYLIRKAQVPLIITARLEKYRPQTEAWLKRWGVDYGNLIMGHWDNLQQRTFAEVVKYKAKHYAQFAKVCRGIKPAVFVESEINQAKEIAKRSKQITVCPDAGQCFGAQNAN